MTRLGYHKSRRGCLRCKLRRVKCDEKAPCSACARHRLACSLAGSSSVASQPSEVAKNSGHSSGNRTEQEQIINYNEKKFRSIRPSICARNADPFPYLASFVTGKGQQDSTAWTDDLELMHQFTAVTWSSLPRSLEHRGIWQLEAPRLAVKHPFLMHQLLAVAAFHMACLYPEDRKRRRLQASEHQDRAIQGLRVVLPTIDDASCHAIFLAACLLCMSAFAAFSEKVGHNTPPSIDDLIEAFLLTRGMHGIVKRYEDAIARGPISDMLYPRLASSQTPLLASVVSELSSLEMPEGVEPAVGRVCLEAAASLIEWIEHSSDRGPGAELTTALAWPISVSDEFIDLMRRRHRAAIRVLLGYYRILDSAGSENWYIEGWGKHLLRDAREVLRETR